MQRKDQIHIQERNYICSPQDNFVIKWMQPIKEIKWMPVTSTLLQRCFTTLYRKERDLFFLFLSISYTEKQKMSQSTHHLVLKNNIQKSIHNLQVLIKAIILSNNLAWSILKQHMHLSRKFLIHTPRNKSRCTQTENINAYGGNLVAKQTEIENLKTWTILSATVLRISVWDLLSHSLNPSNL